MISLMKKLYHQIRIAGVTSEFKHMCVMGSGTRLFPSASCHNKGKRENLVLGERCEVKGILNVQGNGRLVIGDRLYIGGHSHISAVNSVTIGNDVIIANHVRVFDNNVHPNEPEKRRQMSLAGSDSPLWDATESPSKPVVIEDNVWIGDFAAVLKGVTVGRGSVIGMHTVVTKDVPPYSVVVGNPARIVKTLEH